MAIDPAALIGLEIPAGRQTYEARDVMLYALGTGAGVDPLDPGDLPFLAVADPLVLPSFATVLGFDRFWADDPRTGIDVAAVLHVSQGLTMHRPLDVRGQAVRETRIVGVTDKGPERGALVSIRERIRDATGGGPIADLDSVILCRNGGGCGSAGVQAVRGSPMPDGPPALSIDLPTSPQQALIYQLSGDRNPLHVDPSSARRAGFDRPILHGLSAFGAACRKLIAALCGNRPAGLTSLRMRFAGVVFPGDRLALEIWPGGAGEARFRVRIPDRDAVVLDDGLFRWTP